MEDKELTSGEWRLGSGDVRHGWWYSAGQWGLGIGGAHEAKAPCWPEKWTFTLELGPLCWAITWTGDR